MRTNEKGKGNNIFLVVFTPSPFILFADILVADKPAFCSRFPFPMENPKTIKLTSAFLVLSEVNP